MAIKRILSLPTVSVDFGYTEEQEEAAFVLTFFRKKGGKIGAIQVLSKDAENFVVEAGAALAIVSVISKTSLL